MHGLIGKKIGMTRIFDKESGRNLPITVIETGMNTVQQVKTVDRDGYAAIQLGFGACAPSRVNKPLAGHFKRLNTAPVKVLKEFRCETGDEQMQPGQQVGVEVFDGVRFVDVTGMSKGRGFSGTIKRHNFQRGRETHGNTNHREPGSIGSNTYPSRVFPKKKMAGHYGAARVTTKGLELVGVEKEAGLLYIRGSVPGASKGYVIVHKNQVKKRGQES